MALNPIRLARRLLLFCSVAVSLCMSAGEGRERDFRSELTPFAAETLERSGIWDFTGLSALDEDAKASGRLTGAVYFEDLDGCCRAYLSRNDSTFYRGYNIGRHECMLADSLIPGLTRPLVAAAGAEHDFSATGLRYGIPTIERGRYSCHVVRKGTAIVPGDTVRNVWLVREDIATRKFIGIDSTGISAHTVIYRWFREDDELPFAIQFSEHTDEPDADGGWRLFAPDFTLTDMAALWTEHLTTPAILPSAEECLSVLSGMEASVGGNAVYLSFPASEAPFAVNLHLIDLSGNIYSATRCLLDAEDGTEAELPRSGAPRGRYVVAVSPENYPDVSYKIFVDL